MLSAAACSMLGSILLARAVRFLRKNCRLQRNLNSKEPAKRRFLAKVSHAFRDSSITRFQRGLPI